MIADTDYQQRARWRKAVETTRAITQGALADQKRQVAETERASDLLKQMGRPMHPSELRTRLTKANSSLQFQKNNLGNWAILIPRPAVTLNGTSTITLAYTGVWFEDTILPEYSVLHPTYDTAWDSEARDIVKTLKTVKPQMGWRTIVGRLLMAGLVSPPRIRELFGTHINLRASFAEMEKKSGSLRKDKPIQLV